MGITIAILLDHAPIPSGQFVLGGPMFSIDDKQARSQAADASARKLSVSLSS